MSDADIYLKVHVGIYNAWPKNHGSGLVPPPTPPREEVADFRVYRWKEILKVSTGWPVFSTFSTDDVYIIAAMRVCAIIIYRLSKARAVVINIICIRM